MCEKLTKTISDKNALFSDEKSFYCGEWALYYPASGFTFYLIKSTRLVNIFKERIPENEAKFHAYKNTPNEKSLLLNRELYNTLNFARPFDFDYFIPCLFLLNFAIQCSIDYNMKFHANLTNLVKYLSSMDSTHLECAHTKDPFRNVCLILTKLYIISQTVVFHDDRDYKMNPRVHQIKKTASNDELSELVYFIVKWHGANTNRDVFELLRHKELHELHISEKLIVGYTLIELVCSCVYFAPKEFNQDKKIEKCSMIVKRRNNFNFNFSEVSFKNFATRCYVHFDSFYIWCFKNIKGLFVEKVPHNMNKVNLADVHSDKYEVACIMTKAQASKILGKNKICWSLENSCLKYYINKLINIEDKIDPANDVRIFMTDQEFLSMNDMSVFNKRSTDKTFIYRRHTLDRILNLLSTHFTIAPNFKKFNRPLFDQIKSNSNTINIDQLNYFYDVLLKFSYESDLPHVNWSFPDTPTTTFYSFANRQPNQTLSHMNLCISALKERADTLRARQTHPCSVCKSPMKKYDKQIHCAECQNPIHSECFTKHVCHYKSNIFHLTKLNFY